MKVLVIGADGFVGQNVTKVIKADRKLEVITASRSGATDFFVDLLDRASIKGVMGSQRPDVIVNCAGIVANTEEAFKNVEFTKNLLKEILSIGKPYAKLIISGSAAVYGVVKSGSVNEDAPVGGISNYAKSKIEEERVALEYSEKYGIKLTIARIFNPIGPGMGEKFLLTSLLRQINDVRSGVANSISLSRLDTKRDYIDVRDIASAVHALVVGADETTHKILNVGSGHATSNGELLEALLSHIGLNEKPTIIEIQKHPEPHYADCADTTRIQAEFNWKPEYDLNTTTGDIIDGKTA